MPYAPINRLLFIIIISSIQDRVEGWDAMKPLYWMSVISNDGGRAHLSHHHRGGWDELKEVSMEKWWNEICRREKREKHREKHTQTPIRPPQNHMEWPRCEFGTPAMGGERLTACVASIFIITSCKCDGILFFASFSNSKWDIHFQTVCLSKERNCWENAILD